MTPVDDRHLTDDRLIAIYISRRDGPGRTGRPDSVESHLRGCDECSWRFGRMADALDRLRADALAEADAVFTPERLEHQRHEILRRLAIEKPARSIVFAARVRWPGAAPWLAHRWIAAGAVASLLVGLTAAGLVGLHWERSQTVEPSGAMTRLSPESEPLSASVGPAASESALAREEAFLFEVNEALYSLDIAELHALDVLTPRAREEVGVIR